jgi:tetratricopeptide (TPR) repeat protein
MERITDVIDAPKNDRLVVRLLSEIDRASDETPPSDLHPDEETLALFAMGELRGTERDALIRHLSECSACRQTAGAVMSWSAIAGSAASDHVKPKVGWGSKRSIAWVGLAAAASLLLALGMLLRLDIRVRPGAATEADAFAQAVDLLQRGQFDQARAAVVGAANRGIKSDRLCSIEAEAMRQIPGILALAQVGRLTDFGFEIGGATARGASGGQSTSRAKEALEVLARSGSIDDAIALNRGHALLSLQQPREALPEFQKVVDRSPGSALARLGEGLAHYALAEYPAAEEAFRATLRLDPELAAARINLAMTFGEEGKIDEALAAWRDILKRPGALSIQDRVAVEDEAEELRKARRGWPSPGSPDRSKKDQ